VNITVNNNAAGTEATVERSSDGLSFEVIVERIEGAIAGRMGRGAGLAPVLDSRYRKVR
jgi:hypothetical protein